MLAVITDPQHGSSLVTFALVIGLILAVTLPGVVLALKR